MTNIQPGSKEILLEQADIFSSLPDFERKLISESSDYRDYSSDEMVFSEGSPGNALYIVSDGEVVVRKQDDSGRFTDIARFIPGNCFGELDLFSETARAASAYASAGTRLLIFPKPGTGFKAFLELHPELSARILHKILVEIAGRIRRVNTLITENSPLVQELKKQVYRDKLTGLYNQTYITELIRELMGKKAGRFSLLVLKPDNFKLLNDTYGHEAGDTAIRILGRRLLDFTGDDSRTARYKGNAMAVLLPVSTREEAYQAAVRIREFIHHLDVSEATAGKDFPVTASIGISLFPEHGENAEELLFKTHELPLFGRNRGGDRILFPEDRGAGE